MDDWISSLAARPAHELHLTELVLPAQANHYGTLFGPQALALLGKTAYLAAASFAQQAVVMAGASRIEFIAPVPVGALLHLHARISRVGRSSLTVEVRAALDAAPGTRPGEVLRGSFEMVAVDAVGRPCAVQAKQPLQELPLAAQAIRTHLETLP